jgi:hypothetical protein
MRVFRIAVCFSGQPRTWRMCVDAIREFFDVTHVSSLDAEHRVEVDFFGHAWDRNTWRGNGKMEDEKLSKAELDQIGPAFGFKDIVIEPLRPPTFGMTWDGMFYSLMRSLHLKQQYEIANHIEYDLVIKARYDTIYGPGMQFPVFEPHPLVAYTNLQPSKFLRENFANDFHDVLFCADSPTMDILGTFHQNYRVLCTPAALERGRELAFDNGIIRLGPGTMLYRFLVDRGIHPAVIHHPRTYQHVGYTVVREEAMKLGLDVGKDFDQVRQIYLGWRH